MRCRTTLSSLVALVMFAGCGQGERSGSASQPADSLTCPFDNDARPPNPSWPTLEESLPLQYNDSEFVGVYIPAPLDNLEELLRGAFPENPLHPYVVADGVGLFVVGFHHYKHIEGMQPYKETTLEVLVADSESGSTPLYVTDMIVSSKQAQWAGIQGWGYPKILGNTTCSRNRGQGMITCRTEADGKLIVKLEMNMDLPPVPPAAPFAYTLLSSKDGYLVRAPWEVSLVRPDAQLFLKQSPTEACASVELGDHPIALKLKDKIASFATTCAWGEHLHEVLGAGVCTPL